MQKVLKFQIFLDLTDLNLGLWLIVLTDIGLVMLFIEIIITLWLLTVESCDQDGAGCSSLVTWK